MALGCAALPAQSLKVGPGSMAFRMAATGPLAVPQKLTIAGAGPAPVHWTATVSADAPWIALSAASGEASAAAPAAVTVSLVAWRGQAQAPGSYTGTITVSAAGNAAATVKVGWTVVARLPPPSFSYLAGPKNCANPGGIRTRRSAPFRMRSLRAISLRPSQAVPTPTPTSADG